MKLTLVEDLKTIITPERVSINETVLFQHSKDESYHRAQNPDVVVFVETAEEISQILKYANEKGIPVVPFGVGSGLEGAAIPVRGGIVLDFTRMNQVLEVHPDDFLVRVQPGVTRDQLNKELKRYGLFFSIDPGADASIGGMCATNASGTMAVRYGVMKNQVKGLEVVLANGEIIRTGGFYAKSSSGYNLTDLFVGSEGTLGVFSEIILRVYGIPEATMAVRASFPGVDQAVDTAVAIMGAGIPVARIELVDANAIAHVNRYKGVQYPESPTLFLEFHGNEAGLAQDVEFAQSLAEEHECVEFLFETDSKARAILWEARHHFAYSFIHTYRGRKKLSTDVVVPLSELPGAIRFAHEQLAKSGLIGAVAGHVGDGNFHTLMMFNPEDPDEVEKVNRTNEAIVEYALSKGGTSTGEHGVGLGKMKYQGQEHGKALDVMAGIKKQLDPKGILNPGKIFMD